MPGNRHISLHVLHAGLSVLLALAVTTSAAASSGDYSTRVDQRLSEYAQAFPEIQFIRLGEDSPRQVVSRLYDLVGQHALSRDYHYPADTAELMTHAQLERMELMMQHHMPAAALFRVSSDGSVKRPYACIVSLDTSAYEANPMAATHLLLGIEAQHSDVPRRYQLDNLNFLLFTVDHEVYHCLDSYLNGPQMDLQASNEDLAYQQFRSESRADLYAALSHLKNGGDKGFVQKMLYARSMALSDGDCEHYSYASLMEALDLDVDEMPHGDNRKHQVLYVTKIASWIVPDQVDFKIQLANACS